MARSRKQHCDPYALERFLADLTLADPDCAAEALTSWSSSGSEWEALEAHSQGSKAQPVRNAWVKRSGGGRDPGAKDPGHDSRNGSAASTPSSQQRQARPQLVPHSLTSTAASLSSVLEQQQVHQGGLQFGAAVPIELLTMQLQSQRQPGHRHTTHSSCAAVPAMVEPKAATASCAHAELVGGAWTEQPAAEQPAAEQKAEPSAADMGLVSTIKEQPEEQAVPEEEAAALRTLQTQAPPNQQSVCAHQNAAYRSQQVQAALMPQGSPARSSNARLQCHVLQSLDACSVQQAAAAAAAGDAVDDAQSDYSASSSASGWHHNGADTNSVLSSYDLLEQAELIGRGAFGSVYKTMWHGRVHAVKVIEHEDDLSDQADSPDVSDAGCAASATSSEDRSALAIMEAAVSSATNHPNVVQTLDYRTSVSGAMASRSRVGKETRIIMEYCDRGSLDYAVTQGVFHLAQPERPGGSDADLACMALTLREVAGAMAYLHRMHILHRDLKLKNVLLKSSQADWRGFTAKVSDLGLARLLEEVKPTGMAGLRSDNPKRPDCTGTVTHMAPELLRDSANSAAADVYAFGIMMWELYTGRQVFDGMSKVQVMVGVVSQQLRPSFPRHCPGWYVQLARACWASKPRARPTFAQIVNRLDQAVRMCNC